MLDDDKKAELNIQLKTAHRSLFISSVAQQGLTELKDKPLEMLNVETDSCSISHGL
jgi:GTP-binding protein